LFHEIVLGESQSPRVRMYIWKENDSGLIGFVVVVVVHGVFSE